MSTSPPQTNAFIHHNPETYHQAMDLDLDDISSTASFASSSSLDQSIFSRPDDASTAATSRHPSGEHPPANANANINANPAVGQASGAILGTQAHRDVVANLTLQLQEMTVEATRQLYMQPRQSVLALTTQLRSVYADYGQYKSEARLSYELWEFLSRREDMSEGGELAFWCHDEAKWMQDRVDGVLREGEDWGEGRLAGGTGVRRSEGRESGWGDDEEEEEEDDGDEMDGMDENDTQTPTQTSGVGAHRNRGFRINGEIYGLGSRGDDEDGRGLSSDDNNTPKTTADLKFIDPARVHATLSSPTRDTPRRPAPSYTHDSSSTEIVRSLPFQPADIVFTFPSYTAFPGGASTYLTHMNNIIHLHNARANALLRHHNLKYLSEHLNTGFDVRNLAHGYILLRAGIAEQTRDKVKRMFGSPDQSEFGLTTETEAFLNAVFEGKELGTAVSSAATEVSGLPAMHGHSHLGVVRQRIPVGHHDAGGAHTMPTEFSPTPGPVVANRGTLATFELALLARATAIPVDGIRAWWEKKKRERAVVVGMRAWLAAREVERGARAREEGRYFGWEDWEEEEARQVR